MKRSLVVVALFTIPANAAPKSTLTAAQKQTYTTKLRDGRKLAAQKKYAEAIVALQAALVANPNEPTVLSELGYTAYLAKDYAKSEAWTRQALANEATPSIRGATLYNLGLVLEAKHDAKAAIAAYEESLEVRPNSVVRARLAKLSPEAAKRSIDTLTAVPMTPIKTIDAFCAALPKPEGSDACKCEVHARGKGTLAAPFLDVKVVERDCPYGESDNGEELTYLAVQTDKGWFASDDEVRDYDYNLWCAESADPAPVSVTDGRLGVELHVDGYCAGHGPRGTNWERTDLQVVGIGPSGRPSFVTVELVDNEIESPDTAYDENAKGPTKIVRDIALKAKIDKDGTLHRSGKTKGLDKDEAARMLAPHKLAFP